MSPHRFNDGVRSRLQASFATLVKATRSELDVTQAAVARAASVSRAYIAGIESGRANPTLGLATRIAEALDIELDFAVRAPLVPVPKARDFVHARCSAYAQRRLMGLGFTCLREVEITDGRVHGWIDLLAFNRTTGTLLVIEVKTSLDDVGLLERQLGRYERHALEIAHRRRWRVSRVLAWLLTLASNEVDDFIRLNAEVLRLAFPVRAMAMRRDISGTAVSPPTGADPGRGLALIDPSRRRRDWLLPSRADGRRAAAPYRSRGDAEARWRDEHSPPTRR